MARTDPSLRDQGYRCLVAHTRTGAILDELPMQNFDWRDSLDWARPGSMTVAVRLLGDPAGGDASVRAKARAVASAHWYTSLVVLRDTTALYAAPVVAHSTAGRDVTFTCASMRKLFDARMAIAAGYELTPNDPAADVVSTTSARGTARNLLALATTGPGRNLPITLPTVPVIEDITRTFDSIDLASVGERVEDIVGEDGGPDILVRAAVDLNNTQLTWTVDIGDPRLGAREVNWVWDYGINAPKIEEDRDSSNQASRWYQIGDGLDRNRLIATVDTPRFVNDGWPALERSSRDNASIKDPLLLAAQARSSAATNADGITAWSIDVDPDVWPRIGEWDLGDLARFDVVGHPLIDDGSYVHRLIGVQHSPGKASLGTTPVLAAT